MRKIKTIKRVSISVGLQRQRGVAAIMFAIMLPILLGFITLGVEAGRYMMVKGQLQNASEVAALIVSAYASDASNTDAERLEREKITRAVVKAMVPDIPDTVLNDKGLLRVSVVPQDCGVDGSTCVISGESSNFYQYNIDITSPHDRWFPDWTGDGLAFQETTILENKIAVRKIYGSADIAIAVDFAGSTNGNARANRNKPSENNVWIEVVNKITTQAQRLSESSSKKNMMALVPFSMHTINLKANLFRSGNSGKNACIITQWENKDTVDEVISKMLQPKDCGKYTHNNFWTIPLTESAMSINSELEGMKNLNSTVIYEGVIRAAQIVNEGKNPLRLIIVLTDEKESKGDKNHTLLTEKGYCDTLRSELSEDGKYEAKIIYIGLDDGSKNDNMYKCADKPVYVVSDVNDNFLEKIITEDVGSLHYPKPTKQNNKAAGIH